MKVIFVLVVALACFPFDGCHSMCGPQPAGTANPLIAWSVQSGYQQNDAFQITSGTKTKGKPVNGLRVLAWLPKSRSLLTRKGDALFLWDVDQRKRLREIRVPGLWPPEPHVGGLEVALSADAKYFAVFDQEILRLSDSNGNNSKNFNIVKLAKGLGVDANGIGIILAGIAFNPSATEIAVTIPSGVEDPNDWSGDEPCLTILVNLNSGKARMVGRGSPVAWVSKDELLCRVEDLSTDYLHPTIYNLTTGKRRSANIQGRDITWDGKYIYTYDVLRGDRIRVNMYDLKFKKVGKPITIVGINVPKGNPLDPNFVAIGK